MSEYKNKSYLLLFSSSWKDDGYSPWFSILIESDLSINDTKKELLDVIIYEFDCEKFT